MGDERTEGGWGLGVSPLTPRLRPLRPQAPPSPPFMRSHASLCSSAAAPGRRGSCRPRSSSCGSSRKSTSRSATSCRTSITSAATRPRPSPPAPSFSACSSGARRLDPDPTRLPDATPTRTATRRLPARTPARARTRPRRAPPPPPQDRRVVYVGVDNMQANRQLPNASAPGAARSAPETMGR